MASDYHGEPSLVVNVSDLEPREKWIELGRGAFSIVYKTFCQLHNVDVAVKEIRRGNEQHEIQKLVKLSSHDHVVKIKAVVEIPGGTSGIVMEFCDYGLQSLRDQLSSNFIPWPRCLLFMQHIMSGLQFLHRNNITHRDLKPENVMVTKSFTCKIADVGLAKAYHSQSINSSSNAQIFCPSGTPFYISPERWKHPTAVGTQTDDIYSCGILFYKMITNADLFYMETRTQDESFFSMLKMYVMENHYRPETNELDKGATPAPPVVKAVITTCWDEKPEKRKTFDYWTNWLREEIKKMYTDDMIREADEELRQLLKDAGAQVSISTSSVEDTRPIEKTTLENSASPSPRKKEPDEPDSPTHLIPPSLKPLKSIEDSTRQLSLQDNGFQVIVLEGTTVASYYGLEVGLSYSLTSNSNARLLHFNQNNGKRITIPAKYIRSHSVDFQSYIVRLDIWAGVSNSTHPLSVSASSVGEIDHMLDKVTGDTVVDQGGRTLQTNGNFRSHPYQPFNRSQQPKNSLDNRHWHPGPTGGGTTITIHQVENFYASGPSNASMPAVSHPTPYAEHDLTDSEDMITEDDISNVQTDVATAYDTVARLMSLQSESKIIRSNYIFNIEESSYRLIQTWLQTNGSDATRTKLARILYKAKLYDAARRL